jgi:hypothetical protein
MYVNFHEFVCSYVAKMMKNINNLFKQQFLMYLNYILRKLVSWNIHMKVLIEKIYNRHN